jgi:hypothetical protein
MVNSFKERTFKTVDLVHKSKSQFITGQEIQT